MLTGQTGGRGSLSRPGASTISIERSPWHRFPVTTGQAPAGGSMSEKSETDAELRHLKEAVRDTVASGRDLQSHVSELVFSALSTATASFDPTHIRQVIRAALEGVSSGAQPAADSAAVIRKSVAGVEDALLKTAGVSRLAIEEAAGHVEDFSRSDLRRAVDELAALHELFLNVLGDVAKAGSKTAAVTFSDIQRHLRDSGGALGTMLADNARGLQELFPPAVRESLQAGADTAGRAAEELGRMAGGLLAGIARGLEESTRKPAREADADTSGED